MRVIRYLSRLVITDGKIYNEWCDEDKTILRMVFEDDWSWMQCFWYLMRAGVIQMRNKNFCAMIYDLTDSGPLPVGQWMVGKFDWIWNPDLWPETMIRIVVIGGGAQMDEIFAIRKQVSPKSMPFFKRADTLDEALHLIDTWDEDKQNVV